MTRVIAAVALLLALEVNAMADEVSFDDDNVGNPVVGYSRKPERAIRSG